MCIGLLWIIIIIIIIIITLFNEGYIIKLNKLIYIMAYNSYTYCAGFELALQPVLQGVNIY